MMKKRYNLLGAVLLSTVLLAGCGAQEADLVTKTPFPEFSETDTQGNPISNDIFGAYDVTLVNFWSNGCGTCIEEMPELEEMYQNFKKEKINLIGVGTDSGEGKEQLAFAQNVLKEKGVTYANISPNPENSLYKDFISNITGYPTTYIVDQEGNIIGSPIIGNVKQQEAILQSRIDTIKSTQKQ